MTKEKAAALTGALLARKGTATPAGFVRVAPDEGEAAGAGTDPQGLAGSFALSSAHRFGDDHGALALGGSHDESGDSDESWAPLSQIQIQPRPYRSADAEPDDRGPRLIGDPGVVASPALTVEPRTTTPETLRAEPILVARPPERPVPPLQADALPDADNGARPVSEEEDPASESDRTPRIEESAPEAAWEPEPALPAAEAGPEAIPTLQSTLRIAEPEPDFVAEPEPSEPEPTLRIAERVQEAPAEPEPTLRVAEPTPAALDVEPVPRLVVTPDTLASQVESRRKAPDIIVPPRTGSNDAAAGDQPMDLSGFAPGPQSTQAAPTALRFGDARPMVRRRRQRRLRRVLWPVAALLALGGFLGFTWQTYQASLDQATSGQVRSGPSGPQASPVASADGEPTIWASVDELGYAVSQLVAAFTGRIRPTESPDRTVAAPVDMADPPPATFVPVGPLVADGGAAPVPAAPAADRSLPSLVEELVRAPREASEVTESAAIVPEDPDPRSTAPVRPAAAVSAPPGAAESAAPPIVPTLPSPPVAALEQSPPAAVAERLASVPSPPLPPPVIGGDLSSETPAVGTPSLTVDAASAPPALPALPELAAPAESAPSVAAEEPADTDRIVLAEGPPADQERAGSPVNGAELASESQAVARPGDVAVVAARPQDGPAAELDEAAAEDVLARGGLPQPKLRPFRPARPQAVVASSAGADAVAALPPAEAVEPAGGFAVQLSSLKTVAQADREFARLKEDFPELLRDIDLVVREGSVTDRGTFYRVLTSRFDDATSARALCDALRGRGQDCLVVRR